MALVNRPDNNVNNGLSQLYQQRRPGNARPPEGESNSTADTNVNGPGGIGQDQFVPSARSAEADGIRQELDQISDVDEQNVSRLREAVNNGSYTVNSQQVAERILSTGLNLNTFA